MAYGLGRPLLPSRFLVKENSIENFCVFFCNLFKLNYAEKGNAFFEYPDMLDKMSSSYIDNSKKRINA